MLRDTSRRLVVARVKGGRMHRNQPKQPKQPLIRPCVTITPSKNWKKIFNTK